MGELKEAVGYLELGSPGAVEPETVIELRTVDGMFIKGILLPKSGLYPQHSHQFDHSTLLARGSLILWEGDRPGKFHRAPAILTIPRAVKHKFQTLEDDTLVFCLHNLHGQEWISVLEEHQLDLGDL